MILVGTAGHIDHGKSALVEALTGVNPMRLPEEKAREMTINLGFAHLAHPDGYMLGIVDVPGHERLVRTMVAGATGFQLALWVVDAREGLMPQSMEHLQVLDLLRVPKIIPVITKVDLATPAQIRDAAKSAQEKLSAASLSSCSPQLIDSISKRGLDSLKETIFAVCRQLAPDKFRLDTPVYMPIDRSFVVKGIGTVITGTLIRGHLGRGDSVGLSCRGGSWRIRSLHNHFTSVESITAGHRVGVQLHGIRAAEISRGDILVGPGYPYRSRCLNVALRLLERSPFRWKPGVRVLFHAASFEMECRLWGLVRSDDRMWAQIHLPTECCFYPGQRFILRATNPLRAIGGGIVLDLVPDGRRRITEAERAAYEAWDDAPQRLARYLDRSSNTVFDISSLERKWMSFRAGLVAAGSLDASLRTAAARIECQDALLLWHKRMDALAIRLLRHWMEHAAGNKKEVSYLSAAVALQTSETYLKTYLEHLLCSDDTDSTDLRRNCRLTASAIIFYPQSDGLSEAERAIADDLLHRLETDGIRPMRIKEYRAAHSVQEKAFDKTVSALRRVGLIVLINADFVLHAEACKTLEAQAAQIAAGRFTASEFGTYLGISRKYAVPYLEYLGRRGITRRGGNYHVLVRQGSAALSAPTKR